MTDSKVSVVIPSYRREKVLTNTVLLILERTTPGEILVIDQTASHDRETEQTLGSWEACGKIRWIRQAEPSITAAMNRGLREAEQDLVLFLDDDIEPFGDLATVHASPHAAHPEIWATVGQVIQPWQNAEAIEPPRKQTGLRKDFDFPFHSTLDADVENVMAGNLCVNRDRALAIGGFDESFSGSAFRFESEFARRVIEAGGKIRFLGNAGIQHLRAQEGGTRSEGSHLTSASPRHGMGDYYYAFRHGTTSEAWRYSLARVIREVTTRYHLIRPWWIPVKLLGELRGLHSAIKLSRMKPKLVSKPPVNVCLFQRRPVPGHFSMEAIFDEVSNHFPDDVSATRVTSRFTSQGIFRRVYAIGEAFSRRQEVNHITGDVHFLTLGLPKRNTILTIHDCVPLQNHPSGLRHILLKLFWFTLPVRRAATITVVSEATKQELLSHVPVDPEKIRVVPACISSRFTPSPKKFNTERPRILHVGTSPNKNLPQLCKALRGMRCILDVVGRLNPGQRAALESNGIDFENASGLSDDEMVERYRQCDLVAFASTYEGFGMPILEANTVERPIVAGNVCSMPEVADGAACLVDPNDVDSIRNGIERVVSDASYREELIGAGRANRARFQPNVIANQYADLYRELAGAGTK